MKLSTAHWFDRSVTWLASRHSPIAMGADDITEIVRIPNSWEFLDLFGFRMISIWWDDVGWCQRRCGMMWDDGLSIGFFTAASRCKDHFTSFHIISHHFTSFHIISLKTSLSPHYYIIFRLDLSTLDNGWLWFPWDDDPPMTAHADYDPVVKRLSKMKTLRMQIQYSTDPRFFRMFIAGWWFGTCFIFPYIGNNHSNWLIFFRGVQTTNQIVRMGLIWIDHHEFVSPFPLMTGMVPPPAGGCIDRQSRWGLGTGPRTVPGLKRPESHGKFYHGFSHEIFGFFLQHFLWNKSTNLWFFFGAGKWWTWAGLVNQVTLQRSDSSDMNIWLQTWTSCTLVQGSSENRLRSMLTQAPPSSLCARQGCCGCRVFRDQHTTILGSM